MAQRVKYNIVPLVPLDNQLLQNPDDELEKAYKKLKSENEKFKNLIPKLSITFKNKAKYFNFSIESLSINKEQFILDKLMPIRRNFNKLKLNKELEDERIESLREFNEKHKDNVLSTEQTLHLRIISMPEMGFNVIKDEDKIKYNEELELYILEYEEYLQELYDHKVRDSLTIKFELELNNEGTIPAEDIDLYLHFPDGFELYSEDSYPQKTNPPPEPVQPRSFFSLGNAISRLALQDKISISKTFSQSSNLFIKKTNSFDVNTYVNKLKHNTTRVLDTMFVTFEHHNSILSFNVDYEIRCSNVPEVVKGNLNFIINKE